MQVYVVTVQGRFIDVFLSKEDADALKHTLYMSGNDGISVVPKTI
jgi:hypothetical protein